VGNLDKQVKDVFTNLANEDNNFCNAYVSEIKFSKKFNAVILSAKSQENISLFDIEKFERRACKEYELNSFKIDYEYTGKLSEITQKNMQDILMAVTTKQEYTKKIFENCKMDIDLESKGITITLKKPYADFLSLKKVDKYINKCIDTEYGIGYNLKIRNDPSCTMTFDTGPKIVKLSDLPTKPKEVILDQNGNPIDVPVYNNNIPDAKIPFTRPKLTEEEKEERKLAKEPQPENVIYGISIATQDRVKVVDININYDRVCFEGQIFERDERELKSGKILLTLDVTDFTNTIACKMFLDKQKFEQVDSKLKKGTYILVQGRPQIDPFTKELGMSAMDGVSSATDILEQAVKFGHKAIAITDHGVAQSFPEALHYITGKFGKLVKKEKGYPTTQEILDAAPLKVIYGVEGYLTQDVEPFAPVSDTYCVFDLETTGFNPKMEKITEIAVCKVKNGEMEYIEIDDTKIALNSDNLLVTMQGKEGFAFSGEGEIGVVLDTHISPELKKEGYIREILSKVQNMRKDKGFEVLDKIYLYITGNELLENVIKDNTDLIKHDTLALDIVYNKERNGYLETNINGELLKIDVEVAR